MPVQYGLWMRSLSVMKAFKWYFTVVMTCQVWSFKWHGRAALYCENVIMLYKGGSTFKV